MPYLRQLSTGVGTTRREEPMTFPFTAAQHLAASRQSLTSLAAETRRIVDRHLEVESRASRKIALSTLALVMALAMVLMLLGAAIPG